MENNISNSWQDQFQIGELSHSKMEFKTIPQSLTNRNLERQQQKLLISHQNIIDPIKEIRLTQYLRNRSPGELLKLAFYDQESKEVNIDKKFQQLLPKFSTEDIAFIGVSGSKGCGKSFFCDKLLNLCEIKGNNYCSNSQQGIFFWSQPFVYNGLIIFLLELTGYDDPQQYQQMLIYFLMLTSLVVHIRHINQRQNSLIKFQDQLRKIINRITPDQFKWKQIFIPKVIFNLNRSKLNINEEDQLPTFFNLINKYLPDAKSYNYEVKQQQLNCAYFMDETKINKQYVIEISRLFCNCLKIVDVKKFNKLIFRTNILLKLLGNIQISIRKEYSQDNRVNMKIIYKDIIEELYDTACTYYKSTYNDQLKSALGDKKVYSQNHLLKIFQTTVQNVFNKFNQLKIDKQQQQKYQAKLMNHINKTQNIILRLNKKKTQQEFKKQIQAITDDGQNRDFKDYLQQLKQKSNNLDHNRAVWIAPFLKQLYNNAINGNGSVEYRLNQEIQSMERQRQVKSQELNILTTKNKEIRSQIAKLDQKNQNISLSIQQNQQRILQIDTNVNYDSPILKQKEKINATWKRNQEIIKNYDITPNKSANPEINELKTQLQKLLKNKAQIQYQLRSLVPNNNQKHQKKIQESPDQKKFPQKKHDEKYMESKIEKRQKKQKQKKQKKIVL